MKKLNYLEVVDTCWYRSMYSDLSHMTDDQLINHYIEYGANEKRRPNVGFDPDFVSGMTEINFNCSLEEISSQITDNYPAAKNLYEIWFFYLKDKKIKQSQYFPHNYTFKDGYPFPFCENYYLSKYPDIKEAKAHPYEHFIKWGIHENRQPIENYENIEKFIEGINFINFNRRLTKLEIWDLVVKHYQKNLPLNPSDIELDPTEILPSISEYRLNFGIVVYKNSVEELYKCIDSIINECRKHFINHHIYLYVNCDTKYDFEKNNTTIIYSHENIGFGKAHNILMKKVLLDSNDIYFCVNPDGFFMENSIAKSVSLYSLKKDCVIELNQIPMEHPKYYNPFTLETAWFSGACFLIDKKGYDYTLGFDENFYMYCEDVDLSWRIRSSGLKVFFCHDGYFYHDVTSRAFDANENRKKLIFSGAYTLAKKYNNKEKAKEYAEIAQITINDHQEDSSEIKLESLSEYACFDYGLRFSPSRFL